MTREEAKEELIQSLTDNHIPDPEAVEMAIKALEQVPTKEEQALLQKWWDNRGISIKDFMNALQEPCEDWRDIPSSEMTIEQARQAVRDLRKKLAEQLREQTKWIPISERLPKENKTVIASTKYGVYPETRYTKEYGWEWAYESGADYWRELEDVTAWMPLPTKFEPQESEDKE